MARVLDLELKLVPRKAVPAVETVVRSTAPSLEAQHSITPKTFAELLATRRLLQKLKKKFPNNPALQDMQRTLQSLQYMSISEAVLHNIIVETRKFLALLQKQSKAIDDVNLSPDALRILTKAADNLRQIRNQAVHGVPMATTPRPAYRLDDEDGHG
ncbi:hypothetical protein [uncultured Ferrovibrio sp.]|uniref:hypothetical protein n=1 Tax=uncultured Ferrovibrio sp. TaxID=1576913 RepID=UPI0026130861|nr:hypothetical protein [uncultured Ferrovibrio sp.]